MKLILALTDSKRKSISFVTDSFKVVSLKETVQAVKLGQIEGVHIAKRGKTEYLRTNRSPVRTNIDAVSVPWYWFFSPTKIKRSMATGQALELFLKESAAEFEKRFGEDKKIVSVESKYFFATEEYVAQKLLAYKQYIFAAAKQYDIDPYLLGGIFIDEIVELALFEEIRDVFSADTLGMDISVGIAQVKIETARTLIELRYYNPNPKDAKLSEKNISKTSRSYLSKYVLDPKHNVFFGAAQVRYIVDAWMSFLDLRTRPEIIGTLYSHGKGKPKNNPQSIPRGEQIANEFVPLAKKILGDV